MPFISSRGWVIHCVETRLTQLLLAAGLRVKALYPYEVVTETFRKMLEKSRALVRKDMPPHHQASLQNLLNAVEAGVPLNPTHFFWEVLIGHMGFPYLKRDLLEINPVGLPGVWRWRDLIRMNSAAYDVEMIACHQKLRLKNRSI
jgi:hypothetical protein